MGIKRLSIPLALTLAASGLAFAQYPAERNFFACRVGYSTCRPSELTKEQLEIVEQASLARNYSACRNGYASCKPALLNEDQAEAVQTARLARKILPDDVVLSIPLNLNHDFMPFAKLLPQS